eukprot:8723606-Heterocapsa_arctica.AAC.1
MGLPSTIRDGRSGINTRIVCAAASRSPQREPMDEEAGGPHPVQEWTHQAPDPSPTYAHPMDFGKLRCQMYAP